MSVPTSTWPQGAHICTGAEGRFSRGYLGQGYGRGQLSCAPPVYHLFFMAPGALGTEDQQP